MQAGMFMCAAQSNMYVKWFSAISFVDLSVDERAVVRACPWFHCGVGVDVDVSVNVSV